MKSMSSLVSMAGVQKQTRDCLRSGDMLGFASAVQQLFRMMSGMLRLPDPPDVHSYSAFLLGQFLAVLSGEYRIESHATKTDACISLVRKARDGSPSVILSFGVVANDLSKPVAGEAAVADASSGPAAGVDAADSFDRAAGEALVKIDPAKFAQRFNALLDPGAKILHVGMAFRGYDVCVRFSEHKLNPSYGQSSTADDVGCSRDASCDGVSAARAGLKAGLMSQENKRRRVVADGNEAEDEHQLAPEKSEEKQLSK